MNTDRPPAFDTNLTSSIYLAPIVLLGGAFALGVAWLLMAALGTTDSVIRILMAGAGAVSVGLAAVWIWGARRARLTVDEERLRIIPHLGRMEQLALSRLVTVDFRTIPGSAAQALYLVDADGSSVRIGIHAWQREAELFRLVHEAAQRSGADITPAARRILT